MSKIEARKMWETWPLSKDLAKVTLKLRLWEAKAIDAEVVKFALKYHRKMMRRAL